MSGFAFDSNILIDALRGIDLARAEIERAIGQETGLWVSRMVWIQVLSRGVGEPLHRARIFLTGFDIDEIDLAISERAAALRRERPSLKAPDAIILASAIIRGRILVTRNTRDFLPTYPGVRVPYVL